jgi:hypothetical protein
MTDAERYPYYRAKSLWAQTEMYPDDPEKVEAHMREFDERNRPA